MQKLKEKKEAEKEMKKETSKNKEREKILFTSVYAILFSLYNFLKTYSTIENSTLEMQISHLQKNYIYIKLIHFILKEINNRIFAQ